MKSYYVYIFSNVNAVVLYIGVTNSLKRRLHEHYSNANTLKNSFAGRYNCYHLLYYETYSSIKVAIAREKELKGWSRKKKNSLIRGVNPYFEFIVPPN